MLAQEILQSFPAIVGRCPRGKAREDYHIGSGTFLTHLLLLLLIAHQLKESLLFYAHFNGIHRGFLLFLGVFFFLLEPVARRIICNTYVRIWRVLDIIYLDDSSQTSVETLLILQIQK